MNLSGKELLVDIGSSSVAACLVGRGNDGKPMLSETKRVPLAADGADVRGNIRELTLTALKNVLNQMPDMHAPVPVRVFLEAPWYHAELREISVEYEKPSRIISATVAHAVDTAQRKTEKRSGRRNVESAVHTLTVNGYRTGLTRPVKGSALQIGLYESETDADLAVILEKAFPHSSLSFHTFPLSAVSAMGKVHSGGSFAILNVGGEITDLAVVHNGALIFSDSFPEGSRSLLRNVASGRSSASDAFSRMTLFARGELSTSETASFSDIFSSASLPWRSGYEGIVERLLEKNPLPRSLFLLGEPDSLIWFENILSLPARSSIPIVLGPSFFEHAVSLGENAIYDPILSLISLSMDSMKAKGFNRRFSSPVGV